MDFVNHAECWYALTIMFPHYSLVVLTNLFAFPFSFHQVSPFRYNFLDLPHIRFPLCFPVNVSLSDLFLRLYYKAEVVFRLFLLFTLPLKTFLFFILEIKITKKTQIGKYSFIMT